MVTVILRPRGDKLRDNLRARQVHGTLISYAGRDRFAFQIFENGETHLVEFPGDTTHLNRDLLNRLIDILGEENVQVEKITFH